mmetsp:Transcript_24157/g.45828  ORF Transcript_24157/g.45828 Transcript_24157/m.45828 type:complete len:257 (+) Transcript_24157:45-815(+)
MVLSQAVLSVRSLFTDTKPEEWGAAERAKPWTPNLGVNVWVSVKIQWYCTYAIAASVLFWLVTWDEFPIFNAWFPPMLMFVLGYPIFFGFVSHSPSSASIKAYLRLIFCTINFAWLRALVPFMIGCLCGPVFMIAVTAALEKGLVEYDYHWYSITVGVDTGIANAIAFLAQKHCGLSERHRWILLSLGQPCFMSVMPIVMMYKGVSIEAYKLNLHQMIRYSAFQFTVYIFIYYGVCNNLEKIAYAESMESVITVSN